MFSSGSWATMNYLKILPTKTNNTYTAPLNGLGKHDLTNYAQGDTHDPWVKRNLFEIPNKPTAGSQERRHMNELQAEPNSLPKYTYDFTSRISNAKTNSIYHFDVQVPKVFQNSIIRYQQPLNCYKKIVFSY